MTSNHALTEDDQTSCKYVGTFHSDAYGKTLVSTAKKIIRSQADAVAAMNIHRVVQRFTHFFGVMVFENRSDHRGFLTIV